MCVRGGGGGGEGVESGQSADAVCCTTRLS